MTSRTFFHTLAVALLVVGMLGTAALANTPPVAELVASGKLQIGAEEEIDDAVHAVPALLAVSVSVDLLHGLPESARSGARAAPPTPPPEV